MHGVSFSKNEKKQSPVINPTLALKERRVFKDTNGTLILLALFSLLISLLLVRKEVSLSRFSTLVPASSLRSALVSCLGLVLHARLLDFDCCLES